MFNSSDRSFYIIRIYLIKKLYSPLSHERTRKKFMSCIFSVKFIERRKTHLGAVKHYPHCLL